MSQADLGVFLLRLVFGLFMVAHGGNKVFGGKGLAGTAGWFGAIGMKWPMWQARIAAATEIGAGAMFAAGLGTPLAAAGLIGLMIVAIVVAHWKVGFFVFLPNQGWEYCASIIAVAVAVVLTSPGRWSLDHAIDWPITGWGAVALAVGLGVVGAVTQLLVSYRPPKVSS